MNFYKLVSVLNDFFLWMLQDRRKCVNKNASIFHILFGISAHVPYSRNSKETVNNLVSNTVWHLVMWRAKVIKDF